MLWGTRSALISHDTSSCRLPAILYRTPAQSCALGLVLAWLLNYMIESACMVTPVAVHCLQGKVSVEHTAAFEELTALQSKYQELQEEDVAIKVHLCAGSAASICAELGHPT